MKTFRTIISFVFAASLFSLTTHGSVFVDDAAVKVRITAEVGGKIDLRIEFPDASRANLPPRIQFRDEYADVAGLRKRITNFRAFKGEESIAVETISPGEYRLTEGTSAVSYSIRAEVSPTITDSAHVSWIGRDNGLLFPADLLPRGLISEATNAGTIIDVVVPTNWKIVSTEKLLESNRFQVARTDDAVFLIGRNLRRPASSPKMPDLTIDGVWAFTDSEAREMTDSIFSLYTGIYRSAPGDVFQVMIVPFPQENENADRWRAETRGNTVVVVSGSSPHATLARQRLHEQLRHEIGHLWIPNALSLSGSYDWFYEGFVTYQALRNGVELNQLRFDDFLNTLARAYDISELLSEVNPLPLPELSRRRWLGSANLVYAKGMLVAFLCDVHLLKTSGGKRKLSDLLRSVYERHRFPAQREDGSNAVKKLLGMQRELLPVTERYLESGARIDWINELESAGISARREGRTTRLTVMEKPDGRQKDLLDKLGYNQWRKLLNKKK